jgi:hypothetical protein
MCDASGLPDKDLAHDVPIFLSGIFNPVSAADLFSISIQAGESSIRFLSR